MKRLFMVFVLIALIISNNISAQTITSTSAGGNWENTGSWIGGVIPGENNDVVITSTISATSSNSKCKNLTVSSGAVFQNGGGLGWVTPVIYGNIINEGTIRNNPDGNELWLHIYGDVHNNGTWINSQTHFSSLEEQIISQGSGKKFETSITRSSSSGRGNGIIKAASDITFACTVNLQRENYEWSILDMNGFKLNLEGEFYITDVIINNANPLVSTELFEVKRTYFDTDINIAGVLSIIESNVTFGKNLTINGILQNIGSLGWVTVSVNGNLINNGTIRNNPNGNELWIYTYGNLHNNGSWLNTQTNFSAETEQKISQSSGKKFETYFKRNEPSYGKGNGTISALSDITFANNVNLQGQNYVWSPLDMKGYNLNLEGTFTLTDIVLKNAGSLFSEESFQVVRTYFDTELTVEGILSLRESNVTFAKQIILNGIIQNSGSMGWITVTFLGPIVNNGEFRNNPGGNELWTVSNGNILGNGIFTNSRNYAETNGDDNKINGTFYEFLSLKSSGDPKAGKVIINGILNSFGRTQIESGTEAEIAGNGKFYDKGEFVNNGSLKNNGTIYNTFNPVTGLSFNFFSISASFLLEPEIDSIKIESYGNQIPASFGNAVKNWWRIIPFSGNSPELFSNLILRYSEDILNNNIEEELQIFHSIDSGKTWQQISSSANITRDNINNSVAISDAPAYGDYILASSSNPYSVKPSVVVSILGRSRLRIGPPNRYTIHYANNSDTPTDDFFFSVGTGSNTRILSAELPMADGTVEVFPIDSINMEYDDKVATFIIAGLEPGEEGTFDIICTGDPLNKTSLQKAKFEPFTLIAVGIITFGTVKVIDYIGSKAIENTSMSNDDKAKLDLVLSGEVKKEIKKEKSRGKKVFVARKIGVTILGKVMGVVGGVIEVGAAVTRNVKGVFHNLYSRVYLFIQKDVGYFGVEEKQGTLMTTGGKKEMIGATSWDPNEKVGPEGYGISKHISSAGKMHYQILFENKKEASDSAYKIIIIDTLSSVFDPTTIEFGRTSHPGFSFTRDNNILTWEVIGIELAPNVNPPEGEGWVSFSVNTKDDLVSGTTISNKAAITFDSNAPIITNEVINVLDFDPPATQLYSQVTSNNNDDLIIKWTADDGENGSGISATTIFCSVDGDPFEPVVMTFEDSAVYIPKKGSHQYSFYALSEDNVGNLEASFSIPIEFDYTTTIDSDEILPSSYNLSQNYPNPFNPSTTIVYDLPVTSYVKLAIFNILGERISTLTNKIQNNGRYKVKWNAVGLSSGVYFYRIEAKSVSGGKKFNAVKKLMFLK
ncbi:MAG: T9SS type A sorting domain-containing protein [Melioribacteraceae bacterium]|nr:T9SS type A sorting domain-containing protein [Melioribacteraceae bacterium]